MSQKKSLVIFLLIIALSFMLLTSSIQLNENIHSNEKTDFQPMINPGDIAVFDPTEYALEVVVSVSAKEFQVLEYLNKEFMTTHPNIKVDLKNATGKHVFEEWKEAAALGYGADIMLLDNTWINRFAAQGLLNPLSELVEVLDGTTAAVAGQLVWNGYVWGAPLDVEPYMFAWNKALVQQLIADDELDLQTFEAWDTLVTRWLESEQIQSKGETYGIYLDGRDPYALSALAWSLGILSIDEHGEKQIEVQDIELMSTLARWVSGIAWSNGQEEEWEALKQGDSMFLIAPLSEMEKQANVLIQAAPLPVSEINGDHEVLWIKGRSFVMHAKTSAQKQASAWIRDMTSDRSQQLISSIRGSLPATMAAMSTGVRSKVASMQDLREWIQTSKTLAGDPDLPDQLAVLNGWELEEQASVESFVAKLKTLYQIKIQTNSP